VGDRVGDHVLDHAGEQQLAALIQTSGRCSLLDVQPCRRDRARALLDRDVDETGERQRRVVGEWPVLGVGKREQALHQPLRGVELASQTLRQRHDMGGDGAWLGHRHVQGRAHRGERRAQLVRGVRDEAALGGERPLEPVEQPVDRVGEFGQLVARAGEVEALVQVARGDLACRRVIVRNGRRSRPATSQPSASESAATSASATVEASSSSRRSAPCCDEEARTTPPAGDGAAVRAPVLPCHSAMVTASTAAPEVRQTTTITAASRSRMVRRGRRGRGMRGAGSGTSSRGLPT